ncbi:helix-turn-helix domain-containing protein, partial [Streptomyces sp. NPDC051597]|uniref:helix-turn-helix domain-containing protein n=1 Tax=Streptomyces sp. NPDC051597 TaxID=3155049 RepID=UPI003428A60A
AADACGVSRTTIRRRREEGGLPGAVQDPHRGWLIPVEDLLAAGFRLNAPAGPDPDPSPAASPAAVVEHGGHHQGARRGRATPTHRHLVRGQVDAVAVDDKLARLLGDLPGRRPATVSRS